VILITTEGQQLQADPNSPKQLTRAGRESLATSSQPWATYGGDYLRLLSGRNVSFAKLYREQPWVAAMVNKLNRQISRLPLKTYETNSQGDRDRVRDHLLVDLIDNPAPGCSAAQLKQWLAQPTLIQGNSTLLQVRRHSTQAPVRFWPLDWTAMQAFEYSGTDKIASEFAFWRSREFGGEFDIDPRDVVHLKWEAVDSKVGISPLLQLGLTIKVEAAAQEYQQTYLEHGVRPPSAIQLPAGVVIDAKVREEMRADLAATYAGAANAGRPALLPGGIEWKSIAHTAHEAELIDQRKLAREEVAGVYDVPPPMVGILDRATFSNVSEQHKMLFTTVLGPWLDLIEKTFKAQVIDREPRFEGLFVEFDLADVLRGDKTKELAALKVAVQSGLYTVNEARRILNMPAFDAEWCDEPLIPTNNLGSSPEQDAKAKAFAERLADAAERAAHPSND
jgi:HK97 family phage portal protein